MFSMIKINYLMLLLFMTIRDNSVHTKVKNIKSTKLIFKLRCHVTEVKFNFKGKYEELGCRACKLEEEKQNHIIECNILNKKSEEVEYDEIFTGTVTQKLKVARKFNENYKLLEQMIQR